MNPKLSGEIIGEFVPIEDDPGYGVGAKGKGMSCDVAVAVVKEMRASHRPPGRWHGVETYVETALLQVMRPTDPAFDSVMHFGLVMFRFGEMMAKEKKRRGRPAMREKRDRNVRICSEISLRRGNKETFFDAFYSVGKKHKINEETVKRIWYSGKYKHGVETYVEMKGKEVRRELLLRIMRPTDPAFDSVMHFGLDMFRFGEMMANKKGCRGRPKNRYRDYRIRVALSVLLAWNVSVREAHVVIGKTYGIGAEAVRKACRVSDRVSRRRQRRAG